MSDTKLKPCPFCGSEAEMVKAHNSQYPFIYAVICKKADCRASVGSFCNTREGAVKQWNTRKPIDRIVEKLEEEIEKASEEYWTDYDERQITISTLYGAIDIVKAGGIDE